MAEAALIDAPEISTITETQEPLTAPIPESLQKLMERVLPMPGDTETAEEEPERPEIGERKPESGEVPEPEKSAAEKKAAEKKPAPGTGDLKLAPEFEAEPEKKPPVPQEEGPIVTEEMIAAEKNPKKQADLRKLGAALERLKVENAQLKTAPPKAAEEPDTKAVIEQQQQTIAELSGRLERQNVQAHPEFQRRFVRPRQQMFEQAAGIVKELGGDPESFERTMALPGKSRTEALDGMLEEIKSPLMRERLGRLIDGIENVDGQIAAALKDSKGLGERLAREQKIAEHENNVQQEKALLSLLGAARDQLANGIDLPDGKKLRLEVLHKTNKPDFKWWDDQVDEIWETAQEILLKGTPQKMAVAAVLGASAGPLNILLQNERRARKAAEQRLAEYENAEPNLNDRGQRKAAGPADEFGPDADITKVALTRLRRGDFDNK